MQPLPAWRLILVGGIGVLLGWVGSVVTHLNVIPGTQTSTPVGVWHWFIGPDITIKEDGTVEVETDNGHWAWTDKERRGFQISWDGIKVVDSLILSPDGRRLSGINTRGTRVSGERVK